MANGGVTSERQTTETQEPKKRILVVEDEPNARTALVELLSDEGYAVEEATDAFKALQTAPGFAPDLVLTDLKMPGMDGLRLMEQLQESNPELPVVVMTAFSDGEDVIRVLRSGARDCLSKPIRMNELFLVIKREMAAAHGDGMAAP